MKPVDVPKDESGNYILPIELGRLKLLSLGEIIPEEGFFNQNYIFPVGYAIQRTYKSMVHEDEYTVYTCSIDKDENNKPLFCLEAEDAPEIVIRKPTPTAAWSEVLRRSNILRKKEFKNTVSGPEYYGFSLPTVKKLIQDLPRANECVGYQMVDF
ncbi:F/Y rich C-terminus-domain-containing protein [Mycotypha africana]|uniref:F/Y rich C-terminus-domain-containing protein n=1 Tax=Mycotypha africana TaxID=64632 RepID=UPI00230064CB|nr:F/Y rich C-terminus-domain-containing protein [Mycotypha africana]KAI8970334.1 F/Y rich C-terminus-domain-containing protein [Mycotypha africana]